jgi:dihydropteroate synthase
VTSFERPAIMGVLNVTPDSFSDGGEFLDPEAAVAHGEQLALEGAHIIDVGGELDRVLPVLAGLSTRVGVPLSIDTSKAPVASAALARGATFVNDVTALRGDAVMGETVAKAGAELCLVHMKGEPRTMQEDPRYDDVVSEVRAFLEERLTYAIDAGVAEDRVWLDPGIGFGKTLEHNLELIRRLDEIVAIGRPVVFGASRKRFLGHLTGKPEQERAAATVAANVLAYERGASMFRVHDVAPTRDALAVASATLG